MQLSCQVLNLGIEFFDDGISDYDLLLVMLLHLVHSIVNLLSFLVEFLYQLFYSALLLILLPLDDFFQLEDTMYLFGGLRPVKLRILDAFLRDLAHGVDLIHIEINLLL